jgi:hypothetical protein
VGSKRLVPRGPVAASNTLVHEVGLVLQPRSGTATTYEKNSLCICCCLSDQLDRAYSLSLSPACSSRTPPTWAAVPSFPWAAAVAEGLADRIDREPRAGNQLIIYLLSGIHHQVDRLVGIKVLAGGIKSGTWRCFCLRGGNAIAIAADDLMVYWLGSLALLLLALCVTANASQCHLCATRQIYLRHILGRWARPAELHATRGSARLSRGNL